jgi:hypothetical protein
MSFLARFRRHPKEDPEIVRRRVLLESGRLGEATVLGTDADEEGHLMLSYSYTIASVDYQAFQRLDEQQRQRKYDYLPGARVAMRYDPHRPANSVIV